jgi:transcription-repair coupling factor (superfamily II helicase)
MRLSFICEKITSTSKWRELIKYISKNFKNKRISNIKILEDFWSCLISCLYLHLKKTIVVVIPTWEKTMQIAEDIKYYVNDNDVYLFPPRENLPSERLSPSKVTSGGRLKTLNLLQKSKPIIVLTSAEAVLDKIAPIKAGVHLPLKIKVGSKILFEDLIRSISDMDYIRENKTYFPGYFSVRGGILDVFDVTSKYPYRIEFFGDIVESIRKFSTFTQRSLCELDKVNIYSSREIMIKSKQIDYVNNFTYYEGIESDIAEYYDNPQNFFEYIPQEFIILFCDQTEFNLRLKNLVKKVLDSFVFNDDVEKENYILNTIIDPDRYFDNIKNPIIKLDVISTEPKSFSYKVKNQRKVRGDRSKFFKNLKSDSKKIIHSIICLESITRVNRLIDIFDEEGIPYKFYKKKVPKSMPNIPIIVVSPLSSGFIDEESKISVYSQSDLFIKKIRHTPIYKRKEAVPIIRPSDLNPGNYVVHNIHGIGIYEGMVKEEIDGVIRDYFLLKYADGDRLYVPTSQINKIHKYIGEENPPIYRLGSRKWTKAKRKVKRSAKKIAKELLQLYAERQQIEGFEFPLDTPWQREIEDLFPFSETPDQIRAINEVKKDMEKPKPMDRLVCGDVGYGKTEVAIRAALKAIFGGKQVVILVPTTILAQQHYHTLCKRFKNYPIKVGLLSRFLSRKEQRKVIKGLKEGTVDIVVGTHRLLQKDIEIKDLGLIIIDDEQRFGVEHKEKLKIFRKKVDVLTLSATPIPRTLYMSLIGIRDMSVIDTPPQDRLSVKTFIGEINYNSIKDAIEFELRRGGQVFYVHNRIKTIVRTAEIIKTLVPKAKIAIAHGQMREEELEKVMIDFVEEKFNVLICTTIIESGLDIPTVNTMIVEDADQLGLAQLYQLRGRVGRGDKKAYAYFYYNDKRLLTEEAYKRLHALREFSQLGSGFNLAMCDLEIRGAGEILGPEQHGNMVTIGFELYCQLIREAIKEMKGEKKEKVPDITLEIPVSAYVPEDYISVDSLRIEAYREIKSADTLEKIDNVTNGFIDRYGTIPEVLKNLIKIAKLKILMKKAGILKAISTGKYNITFFPVILNKHQQKKLIKEIPEVKFQTSSKSLKIYGENNFPRIKLLEEILNQIINIKCIN